MLLNSMGTRYLAIGLFITLSAILIGVALYQANSPSSDNSVGSLNYLGQIESFSLPSTLNQTYNYTPGVKLATVVSFIYTKCPGTQGCALLTQNMAELEGKALDNNWKSKMDFVSIDFDYVNDSMIDLVNYANRYTSDFDFWHFLLGNETQTHAVADQFNFYFQPNNGSTLKLAHTETGQKDPYIHSEITYVLDRQGNIRKMILGTDWNFQKILNSLEFLISSNWAAQP